MIGMAGNGPDNLKIYILGIWEDVPKWAQTTAFLLCFFLKFDSIFVSEL